MEANKILSADILDIIFEGKNKSYGAYDLRKTYNQRIKKAIIATGIVLALLVGAILISAVAAKKDTAFNTKDAEMAEVKKDVPPPPPPIPPPPPPPPPPPAIKSIQYTAPVVKKDIEIKEPKKIEEIKEDDAISTETIKTENTKQEIQKEVPKEITKSEIIVEPKKEAEDEIFNKVEIDADYPGGLGAFRKYLEKNLNNNTPTENGAPVGNYTVVVRFNVMKDGSINEVVAETDPGYGCAAEAVKIIKKSNKWKPGIQNGTSVSSVKRQPITFQVADE